MTTLQVTKVSCLLCREQFSHNKVLNTNCFGGRRTDFREYATGVQPLPYFICQCPSCYFAWDTQSQDRFEELIEKADSFDLLRLRGELERMRDKKENGAAYGYEVAARVVRELAPIRHVFIGDLWLRAAWCCMDAGDVEAERYYRIRAVEEVEAYCNFIGDLDDDFERFLPRMYLVGELWRRIGDKRKAEQAFNNLIRYFDLHRERFAPTCQWVRDAAIQQRDHPREWF